MMRMSTPRWSMWVAKLWRSECGRKSELKPQASRALDERGPCARIGQMGHRSSARERATAGCGGFPDLAEHLEDRFASAGKMRSLLPFPRTRRTHLLESDCGDRQA